MPVSYTHLDVYKRQAYDIELEYGVPISVNIKNEKHFKNWVNSLPYYSNIQKEGIIICLLYTSRCV